MGTHLKRLLLAVFFCACAAAPRPHAGPAPAPAVRQTSAAQEPLQVLLQGGTNIDDNGSVRWAPDGSLFVILDHDAVEIRDAQNGVLRASIDEGGYNAVSWSPDSSVLAVLKDQSLLLWDMSSGALRKFASDFPYPMSCISRWRCTFWSPDGRRLLWSHDSGFVLWDVRSGALLGKGEGGSDQVAWAPSGDWFALLTKNALERCDLAILDGRNGTLRRSLPGASLGGPRALATASSGTTIAVGSEDRKVRLVDGASGAVLGTSAPLDGPVTALAFGPDAGRLAIATNKFESGSVSSSVALWDLTAPPRTLLTHLVVFDYLLWSTADRVAALSYSGFRFYLFSPDSGALLAQDQGTLGTVAADFTGAVRMLGTQSALERVDLTGRAVRFSLPYKEDPTSNCALSPAGDEVRLQDTLIDLRTGALRRRPSTLETEFQEIPSRVRSPDGARVAHLEYNLPDVEVSEAQSGKPVARVPRGSYQRVSFINPDVILLFCGKEPLRLLRLSDRASLDFYIDEHEPAALFVRSDGAFDGDEAMIKRVRVRQGGDLRRAPLRPPEDFPKLRRPGLYQAFVAGQR